MYMIKFIGEERGLEEFLVDDLEIKYGVVICRGCDQTNTTSKQDLRPYANQISVPLCKVVVITPFHSLTTENMLQ